VHDEFRRVLEFWFDRGVAGFRIDVAHALYKDAQLRDNPPVPAQDAGDELAGQFGLRQVYNANQPQVHGVYRDWRKIAGQYAPERLLLGETWVRDPAALASFYGRNDELQLAFNFPFVFAGFTAAELSAVVARTLETIPAGACPVWMASNHDVGRFPSRWCGDDDRRTRLALLLLMTLPGAVVLYYGDEIGMLDVAVPPELQRDAMTLGEQGPRGNRDRGRTPMQWDSSPSGGFTAAARPWLPVGDAAARNVADERADPGSTLSLCRELLALRRAELGGGIAPYRELTVAGGLWAYQVGGLTVAANLSGEPVTWPGPAGPVLLATSAPTERAAGALAGAGSAGGEGSLDLAPWEGVITRTVAGG
jgi:alpha-glucosidase